MTSKLIPVSMSYQLPDQVSPSIQMITTTVEQLNEATDLMRGTHPSQISTTTPSPLALKSFTATMNALNEDLALYETMRDTPTLRIVPRSYGVNPVTIMQNDNMVSINTILEMAQRKVDGKCKALIVTGCLAQRYKQEIIDEIPEVDGILGTSTYDEISH